MSDLTYSDAFLRRVLDETKCIAAVGVSKNTVRPSWFVSNYLHIRGYRIIPVNPVAVGHQVFGADFVSDFSEIPASVGDIQMVDVFRRSEHVVPIVESAIDALKDRGLKFIWMQIGVINETAAKIAEDAGLEVIMDRCPKMEYQRLRGELSRGGINSGLISSKLR